MKAQLKNWLTAICLGVLSTAALSAKTIKNSLPGDMVSVTFDESRVGEEDVRSWLQLDETASATTTFIALEFCPADDERYSGCNREARVPDPKYADINVDRIRNSVLDLRSMTVPAGLEPVRAYLLDFEEFWLWKEQQKLAFLKTGDADVLAQPWGRVDPELTCHQILTDIRNAQNAAQRWFLADFTWNNCMLEAERKEIGEYPTKQWQSFLKSEGIVIQEEEDDD